MNRSNRSALVLVLALGGVVLVGCPGTDAADNVQDTDSGPSPDVPGNAASTTADSATPPKDGGADSQEAGPPPCGSNTTLCKDGEKCGGALDCVSKVCRDGTCKAAAPADGVKNGDETDVDCGGKSAPACDDLKACLVKDDCKSGVCTGNICQAPTPTDGVKNGDETDVDCGGAVAPACAVGKGCKVDGDCDHVKCDPVQKKCNPPSHTDGIKNGDETGIDCGGPTAPKCGVGEGCVSNADCNNVACDVGGTNLCLPPSSTDGIKNGTETDVDCGGGAPTNAPGCATGKVCAANADCASNGCTYLKKCAEAPSCVNHNGGDTCGPAGNESCCVSLPASAAIIDKYNITAGRMRAFVDATGGNLRGYIQANAPAWWNASWTQYLPTKLDNGTEVPDYTGVYQELGPNVHGTAGPANEGCMIKNYGARTYRLTDAANANLKDPQYYTQAVLDQRALNCVPAYMIAAFCAWDVTVRPSAPLRRVDGGRIVRAARCGSRQGPGTAGVEPALRITAASTDEEGARRPGSPDVSARV